MWDNSSCLSQTSPSWTPCGDPSHPQNVFPHRPFFPLHPRAVQCPLPHSALFQSVGIWSDLRCCHQSYNLHLHLQPSLAHWQPQQDLHSQRNLEFRAPAQELLCIRRGQICRCNVPNEIEAHDNDDDNDGDGIDGVVKIFTLKQSASSHWEQSQGYSQDPRSCDNCYRHHCCHLLATPE